MEIIKYLLCTLLVSIAVISDYRTYKIKNKLNLTFLIIGLLFNLSTNGLDGGKDAILGSIFPLVVFPLFALKMLGAGDIKAFCAIGSIFGLEQGTYTMLFSFIAGGFIAVFFLIFRKNAVERFNSFWNYLKMCFYIRKLLPYDDFSDPEGKFRFAYGIFGGVILTIINNSIKVV